MLKRIEYLNPTLITCFTSFAAGIGFTILGFQMRSQNKRNWKAFIFLGVALVISVVVKVVFGVSIQKGI